MDRNEVYQEIERTFGFVPDWIKDIPDLAIGEMWELMKKLDLSDSTSIPPKYKELIGVAVATVIRCQYCTYFHTEAAKLNGASDEEVKEAVLLAGLTNLFSNYLNGSQYDLEHFKKETDKMAEYARDHMLATIEG